MSGSELRLTVVGTGAMACLFGARLASVADVTMTGSWAAGVEAIRMRGILVGDPPKATSVQVSACIWGSDLPPADLALILVKSWQTPEVARTLDRLLKADAIAVTLQNGLGNREMLGERSFLGVTYQGATLLGPGQVRPGGAGPTWIASPAWVVELFRRAGIATELRAAAEIDALAWGKLVVNCGINAATALLRVPNGELLRRPAAARLMESAALECAEVARAHGIQLPFADPAAKAREVARLTAVNYSSMLQDVLRGAPTEVEAIYGSVVNWGKCHGVPTPVNEMLLCLVRALQPRFTEKPDQATEATE